MNGSADMTAVAEVLANEPFFAGLSPDYLQLIAECGHNVHFGVDQRVLTVNAPADHFYVLGSGKVAIEIDTPRGGPVVIETISANDILGISWLLPPYRWTFDARAVEPTTAVALDASCLRAKCDGDPLLGYDLYKRFAALFQQRLTATRLQLLDVYGSNDS